MARARVKLNLQGFRDLRNSPGVMADLEARAERLADACGDGYEPGSRQGRNRGRAGVVTATYRAMRDNAKNNTLVANMDAAAGG